MYIFIYDNSKCRHLCFSKVEMTVGLSRHGYDKPLKLGHCSWNVFSGRPSNHDIPFHDFLIIVPAVGKS